MKTLKNVLLCVVLGLMGFIAIPFIFVEFRNFFSFDFIYTHSPFLSGLAYFLRGIYFLLILTLAVFTILFIVNKKKICIILFATGASLFVGAILSLLFYDWYISLILIFITVIQLTIISFGFFKKEEEKESCPINK